METGETGDISCTINIRSLCLPGYKTFTGCDIVEYPDPTNYYCTILRDIKKDTKVNYLKERKIFKIWKQIVNKMNDIITTTPISTFLLRHPRINQEHYQNQSLRLTIIFPFGGYVFLIATAMRLVYHTGKG